MAGDPSYEEQLRSANEIVYKHSLELARLTKSLEIANAQQESLIHFISHEVKGALSKGHSAFGEILEGTYGPVSPELVLFSQSSLVEMKKGIAMVMDILDAANLKKGTLSFTHAPFNIAETVHRSFDELRVIAEKKGLGMTCAITLSEYTFSGDEGKFEKHVFRNLIDNAIKYTRTGEIVVSLSSNEKMITFTVKDSGVGITPEDRVRLFTEGGKGKDSTSVNVQSTGYGLYIAKQVVEAHGGSIRAESAGAGQGSEFIVELPRTSATA